MSSFKLEKSDSAKKQAVSAGALLIILGIVTLFLFVIVGPVMLGVGALLIILGVVFMLGGKFASS